MAFVRIFFDIQLKDHFYPNFLFRNEQSKKKMNDKLPQLNESSIHTSLLQHSLNLQMLKVL